MDIIREGRHQAMSMAREPDRDEQGRAYLRTIARELERHLMVDPACAVHWITPVGEASSFGPPVEVWTHDDALLQVSLAEGFSEGMLIYVHAQPNRYKPGELTPLLRVKVLCGRDRAVAELGAIWSWLCGPGLQQVLSPKQPSGSGAEVVA